MSSFPGSPRLIKGGIVLLDPETSVVQPLITLQYNPDTLTRNIQMQAQQGEGERLEALRLKGPAVETIRLEAEIDAADQLEFPDQNRGTIEYGIQPQLAALESVMHPPSSQLTNAHQLASQGVLEIMPAQAPLTLFVWSRTRILPVRITEFTVTEEMFDPRLNPIRAKVTLALRVLTVNDLEFSSKGASLFMVYLQQKEALAKSVPGPSFGAMGIEGIR